MTQLENIENAFTKEGENLNLEVDNLNLSCITSKNNNFELDSNGNLVVNSITANNLSLATDAILNVISRQIKILVIMVMMLAQHPQIFIFLQQQEILL